MQRCFFLAILLLSLCITACGGASNSQCIQQTPPPRGEYIISGTVWNDTDNDEQWNNGEQAACNLSATISLVDSNGQTVQTVQVNVDGGYAFSDLPGDTYSLS